MKHLLWSIVPSLLLCMSCESKPKAKNTSDLDTLKVGSDIDKHGCKGSAGYQWSELLQDCIRLWETGTAIMPIADTTKAGYIVFAKDSTQVELFLPDTNNTKMILDRRKDADGAYVWNIEDDDTFNLKKVGGLWEVTKREKVVFKQR